MYPGDRCGEYVGRGYQCSRVFNRPGSGGWWNASDVMTRRLFARLRRLVQRRGRAIRTSPLEIDHEAIVRAHADWIAFLATILEREGVIASGELARLLTEFATVTAVDRPAEGRILSLWASNLQGTADGLHDLPSLH